MPIVSACKKAALLTVAGLCLTTVLVSEPAEARGHRRVAHHRVVRHNPVGHVARSTSPLYAAMVVDANTGRTLYAENEDGLRHPASISKVMTLYLLFEQLDKGRFSLDSQIPISAHAAAMEPSKLGIPPGGSISVENAIRAICTLSANDIAVAVAEAIGGDETRFAEMMTAKARAIGMSRTHYANASGLPNPNQITTAHDLTVLGRAINDRFPRYFAYFSTPMFRWGARRVVNHNHLLGRIQGLDGIKTGYVRASGFNLLASVRRNGRHLVAVVLGGMSGTDRDRRMTALIEQHMAEASPSRGAMVADGGDTDAAPAPVAPAPKVNLAALDLTPKIDLLSKPDAQVRATAPARPAFVAATARPVGEDMTGTASIPDRRPVMDGSTGARAVPASATPSQTPPTMRWVAGPAGAPAKPSPAKVTPARVAEAVEAKPVELDRTKAVPDKKIRGGTFIQIGATDEPGKATDLLARARTTGRAALASATPYTEKVQKGGETLYRARFAGLEPEQAEAACKALKRSGFSCFTAKN